jgi:hypothetical protein
VEHGVDVAENFFGRVMMVITCVDEGSVIGRKILDLPISGIKIDRK